MPVTDSFKDKMSKLKFNLFANEAGEFYSAREVEGLVTDLDKKITELAQQNLKLATEKQALVAEADKLNRIVKVKRAMTDRLIRENAALRDQTGSNAAQVATACEDMSAEIARLREQHSATAMAFVMERGFSERVLDRLIEVVRGDVAAAAEAMRGE